MSLMLFTDRLFLSRYSVTELNAAATAGTATYAFMVLPISIAAISEVFVGRFHGQERNRELGKPVWQMIWFALLLFPLFLLIGAYAPPFIFFGSANEIKETTYFSTLINFSPIFFINIGISGFFIGTGKVTTVTVCTLLANLLNIILDYLLIFGNGYIPTLGIFGAALSTGIAEVFQSLMLILIFLQKDYRLKYRTGDLSFDKSILFESLRIGFPSGLGVTIEMLSHLAFFKLISLTGQENLTIVSLVQSLLFLVFFLYDGLSKGVTTLCANFIGGEKLEYIGKTIRSAMTLQLIFFIIVCTLFTFFSETILDIFMSQDDEQRMLSPSFLVRINWALFWMSLFFLFDGLTRIIGGQLTAAGDTKFLLYAGTVLNIVAYLIPLAFVVLYAGGQSDDAWMVIFCYSVITFLVYLWRYRSDRWLVSSQKLNENV
jgi:MATE family multidrug resistance protein